MFARDEEAPRGPAFHAWPFACEVELVAALRFEASAEGLEAERMEIKGLVGRRRGRCGRCQRCQIAGQAILVFGTREVAERFAVEVPAQES